MSVVRKMECVGERKAIEFMGDEKRVLGLQYWCDALEDANLTHVINSRINIPAVLDTDFTVDRKSMQDAGFSDKTYEDIREKGVVIVIPINGSITGHKYFNPHQIHMRGIDKWFWDQYFCKRLEPVSRMCCVLPDVYEASLGLPVDSEDGPSIRSVVEQHELDQAMAIELLLALLFMEQAGLKPERKLLARTCDVTNETTHCVAGMHPVVGYNEHADKPDIYRHIHEANPNIGTAFVLR